MQYSLCLEQIILARTKFAIEPQVSVNFANGDEPVESISFQLGQNDRFIRICVGAKNLDWEERYNEKCQEVSDCIGEIQDKDDEIEGLKVELNERDTEIAELNSQIEELEDANTSLLADKERLEDEIEELKGKIDER